MAFCRLIKRVVSRYMDPDIPALLVPYTTSLFREQFIRIRLHSLHPFQSLFDVLISVIFLQRNITNSLRRVERPIPPCERRARDRSQHTRRAYTHHKRSLIALWAEAAIRSLFLVLCVDSGGEHHTEKDASGGREQAHSAVN